MDITTSNTSRSLFVGSDEQMGRDGCPHTIPALREWTNDTHPYTLGPRSRIVLYGEAARQLEGTGQIFADDIELLSGFRLPVVSDSVGQECDILLMLDCEEREMGDEGYVFNVSDRLKILARSAHGVFNGTRTALQLFKQNYTIPGGVGRDWPDYPERSLMVDMGRKYFSLAWLENHIRDLAYLKYNYFHFHLSDNFGFRLESERHPEIVSPEHYTKEQIRALIEMAQRYHITIVPEIDMPGHMDTVLAAHPELQLMSAEGKLRGGDIDLGKEESYRLMQDLLEEYIPLFPGPYWHIGADEYTMNDDYARYPQLYSYARQHYGPQASARDCYLGFVNWANEIVKVHGKMTRAWNDGLHGGSAVSIASDIVCEHWHRSALEPREIVDLDFYIMNSNADHLYYVLGNGWRALPDSIYSTFEQHIFHGTTTIDALHPRHLGAKLHVWCDNPELESEVQIAEGIACSLRALAQKNWGSAKLAATYDDFLRIIKRIGHAPGYSLRSLPEDMTPHVQTGISLAEGNNPHEH